ncbi:MAG: hypothetical protein ACRCXC_04935 [Legionella sp.]
MFSNLMRHLPIKDVRTQNGLKRLLGIEASSTEKQDETGVSEFFNQLEQHHTLHLDDLSPNRCTYASNQFMAAEALAMLSNKTEIVTTHPYTPLRDVQG